MAVATAAGARRVVRLQVAGAFHTALMQSAADGLAAAVGDADLRPARFPVVSNAEARPLTQPAEIGRALVAQLTTPVRWVEGSRAMADLGATRFLEVGTGTVCAGLLKKCLDGVTTTPCAEAAHVDAAAAFVRADG